MESNHSQDSLLGITFSDVKRLLSNLPSQNGTMGYVLFFLGVVLTPITLIGLLWGYVRAYMRFRFMKEESSLSRTDNVTKFSMLLFGVLIWVLLALAVYIAMRFYEELYNDSTNVMDIMLILVNFALCTIVMLFFRKWQNGVNHVFLESDRHTTGGLIYKKDLKQYDTGKGLYIGDGLSYEKKGHILTCAGTTSGKATNLQINALLDHTRYDTSWFIIDPKGQLAYVTARHQKEKGQRVLIIDPWKLHNGIGARFNPLDLLKNDENLADDAVMIAENILPHDPQEKEKFWSDRSRSIIAGLIAHIVLSAKEKTLTTLWRYLRLGVEDWAALMIEMKFSENEMVRGTANEIEKMVGGDRTFSSIMAHAMEATDFLKSPQLQRSLGTSDFNINDLSDGKTTVYVIIPADKIDTHFRWLRLVVSTAMTAVIRNKNKRVTFMIDEFPSLGKMDQVAKGLNYMAGYNLSLWMIVQNLNQLLEIYGKGWENFISNTAVKHYFGISDNFTARYIKEQLGTGTFMTYEEEEKENINTSARPIADIPEIMKKSEHSIFTAIERNPMALLKKRPYHQIPELKDRADADPYFDGTTMEDYLRAKLRNLGKEAFQEYMNGAYKTDPYRPKEQASTARNG